MEHVEPGRTAEITGTLTTPQPWPWPRLHSCHYFNRSFESFQKCIQWKTFHFLSQGWGASRSGRLLSKSVCPRRVWSTTGVENLASLISNKWTCLKCIPIVQQGIWSWAGLYPSFSPSPLSTTPLFSIIWWVLLLPSNFFLYIYKQVCVCVCVCVCRYMLCAGLSHSVLSNSLWPHGL